MKDFFKMLLVPRTFQLKKKRKIRVQNKLIKTRQKTKNETLEIESFLKYDLFSISMTIAQSIGLNV